MQRLILVLFIVGPFLGLAQTKFEKDTLYTISGFKIHKGMDLLIGTGSGSEGDFIFIRRNSTGFTAIMAAGGRDDRHKDQLILKKSYAGHKGEVVKIVERGSKKIGYTYEPLISLDGGARYEIDIDNAINSGELVIPAEFRPKPAQLTSSLSVSEQLEKLSQLYKDSLITKDEFVAGKKKILAE